MIDAGPFPWLGLCYGDVLDVRPYDGALPELLINIPQSEIRVGLSLDTETTGIDPKTCKVLEIGIRAFAYSCVDGSILRIVDTYDAFQDPGEPISEEITGINGITNEMVAGKSIDLDRVRSMLDVASIVIAHNAGFDRPFVEAMGPMPSKVWACSDKQIEWKATHGLPSAQLQTLCWLHGFYSLAHRAGSDAASLVRLLATRNARTGNTYLLELLEMSRLPWIRVSAYRSPYETKDVLKRRRYQWDSDNKVWHRTIVEPRLEEEMAWLRTNVYGGGVCKAGTKAIEMTERFR